MLEKLNEFRLTSLKTLVLLMCKLMDLFFRKNHLLRCWGWLSLVNWIGAHTLSLLLKLPPRKLESWFVLWSFFNLRFLLPCIESCCHVWTGAPSSYFELLDRLHKQICRTVGSSLAASLEPFAHRLNWLNWFHFLILEGGLLVILIDCMVFMSPFLDVTRMSMLIVSFLAQWDSAVLCL